MILETEIQVPNNTDDSTFVYIISNGTVYDIVKRSNSTDYATANLSCQNKGGFLAVIDTKFKQDLIQNLIRNYFTSYKEQKGTYLFGDFQLFIFKLYIFTSGLFVNYVSKRVGVP